MPDVAVLGLGLMGSAVANAFVEAGHDVTVWNRSPGRSDAFRDRARVAASCRDAVVSSPVIITMMVDYAAAEEVLATVADLLVGRVVVNLISGTPQSARAMQTLVTAYGAAYLDAAIPGYPQDIGNEQFGVYVSGPAPLWERHRELLTSLGGANVHTGEDIGDAALTEMLIFAFYMPAMAAFLEAAALATANGRSIHDLVNDTVPLIDMLKREFALIADSFAVGDFETNQAHIDIFAGSSRLALEAVQGVHQHGAVTRAALDVFGRAADSGLGRLKPAAVIRHLIAPQSQALPRAGRSDSLLSPE